MNAISLLSYPKMNTSVSLHLWPHGGWVFSGDEGVGEQTNKTGMEILMYCDGVHTINDIAKYLRHLYKDENESRIIDGISSFITTANQRGYIELCAHPAKTQIKHTGSFDYPIPLHATVELTLTCNLRCIFCYRNSSPERYERLPTDKLLSVLKELAKHGIRGIELTGGEPLMHPDFSMILETCSELFQMITILTNGCLINEEMAEKIASCRDRMGRIFVQTDLDGSTAELHDSLRSQRGSHAKAKRAISLLARHNIHTRVVMSVSRANAYDVENTLLLAQSLGATMFNYSPVLDIGRGQQVDLQFSAEETKMLAIELRKLFKEKYKGFFFEPSPYWAQSLEQGINCGAGWRTIVIGPTGKVRPCLILPEEYLLIGDLSNDSVEKVFSNGAINILSELVPPTKETCGECSLLSYCMGCGFARPIYAQQKRSDPCNWFNNRGLAKLIQLDGKETPQAIESALCPQISHHDNISHQ